MKTLTFVTADRCRTRLEQLTRLLVSAFPGSTVYQHADFHRVPHDVLHNKVDAVLLGVELSPTDDRGFVELLRRQKPDIPVFVVSKCDKNLPNLEKDGANGWFVLPESEQQLLDAIRQVGAGVKASWPLSGREWAMPFATEEKHRTTQERNCVVGSCVV